MAYDCGSDQVRLWGGAREVVEPSGRCDVSLEVADILP